VGGGAWPFLVGGAIYLVNYDNNDNANTMTSHYSAAAMSAAERPQLTAELFLYMHPQHSYKQL